MSAHDLGPRSTPAVISYAMLALFAATTIGVFVIIFSKTPIDPLMAGVLGTVLGATGTGYAAVQGFWIGSSSGSKSAQTELADANKLAQGALAQLAGSGPQPPSAPITEPQPEAEEPRP